MNKLFTVYFCMTVDDLAKRHAQTLLANFGSNEQEQRAVEILTSEITSVCLRILAYNHLHLTKID